MIRSSFDPGNPTGDPNLLAQLLSLQEGHVGGAGAVDQNGNSVDSSLPLSGQQPDMAMGGGGGAPGGGGGLPFLPSHAAPAITAAPVNMGTNQAAIAALNAGSQAPAATSGFNWGSFLGLNTPGMGAGVGLNLLGALLAPKPYHPTSFNNASGSQGQLVQPINALYNALNGTNTMGAQLNANLNKGVNLKSSFVQPGAKPVQIPGLNFQIGGGLATDPAYADRSLLNYSNPGTYFTPDPGSTAGGNGPSATPRKRVG